MQNLEPVMGLQGVTKLVIINFMILTSILGGSYGSTVQDYCQAGLFNKNFRWETTRKLEAALEWSMF